MENYCICSITRNTQIHNVWLQNIESQKKGTIWKNTGWSKNLWNIFCQELLQGTINYYGSNKVYHKALVLSKIMSDKPRKKLATTNWRWICSTMTLFYGGKIGGCLQIFRHSVLLQMVNYLTCHTCTLTT